MKEILIVVEEVDGEDAQVGEDEENIAKPEEDLEQSQTSVEPESIISQATI